MDPVRVLDDDGGALPPATPPSAPPSAPPPSPAPAPPPPVVSPAPPPPPVTSPPAVDPAIAARMAADNAAYLARYPDVAAAVAAGTFSSGWDHYNRYGRAEGRIWGVVSAPAPAPAPRPPAAPAPPPAPPPPATLPPLPDPASWRGGHVGQAVIDDLIAEGYPASTVYAWARAVNALVETANPLIPPPPDEPPPPSAAPDGIPEPPPDVELAAGDEPAGDRSLLGASPSYWRLLAAYARFKYTEGNRKILNAWASSESTPALINNPLGAHRVALGSAPWGSNPQIQTYPDPKTGAYATARQLGNGNYDDVLGALRRGHDAIAVYNAVHGSGWHQGARQDHYPADLYDYIYGTVAPPVNEPPAQPQPGAGFKPAAAGNAWSDITWFFGHQWPKGAQHASSKATNLQRSITRK